MLYRITIEGVDPDGDEWSINVAVVKESAEDALRLLMENVIQLEQIGYAICSSGIQQEGE